MRARKSEGVDRSAMRFKCRPKDWKYRKPSVLEQGVFYMFLNQEVLFLVYRSNVLLKCHGHRRCFRRWSLDVYA